MNFFEVTVKLGKRQVHSQVSREMELNNVVGNAVHYALALTRDEHNRTDAGKFEEITVSVKLVKE